MSHFAALNVTELVTGMGDMATAAGTVAAAAVAIFVVVMGFRVGKKAASAGS